MLRPLAVLTLSLAAGCGSYADADATGDHDAESSSAASDQDTGAVAGGSDAAADMAAELTDGGADAAASAGAGFYGLQVADLEGETVDFSEYAGDVTLVVNVASECGYTPQYAGLQALHEELAPLGVRVLGFPSNEFGGQEPGSAEQIRDFCTSNFGVTFPMMAKVETQAGDGQSPVYGLLGEATGELPNWNFCKYLIDRQGQPVAFFKSGVAPDSPELRSAIQELL